MTAVFTSPLRIACALVLGATLGACNLNRTDDAVRTGPQAVHPSTYAPGRTAVDTTARTCGGEGQPACYTPVAGDGSRPIID